MAKLETPSGKITCKTPFPKLAQPALRALTSAGYDHLEQLAAATESSLSSLHGFGPSSLSKLRDALNEIGLSFSATRRTNSVPANFAELWCDDRSQQGVAYQEMLEATSRPVDWAYEVWDDVLAQLTSKGDRNRSIAAQILCNLAQSDPSHRLLHDFPALFNVVTDERFVTARHALQAMWKVGCISKKHQDMVVSALEQRFADCVIHKNCTLIRYDIIESLRKLFDVVQDETIKSLAQTLIERESDTKYRKKYQTLWPKK